MISKKNAREQAWCMRVQGLAWGVWKEREDQEQADKQTGPTKLFFLAVAGGRGDNPSQLRPGGIAARARPGRAHHNRRDAMKFPLGAMTVGDILDRGLKLLLARFPTFLSLNLLAQTPVLILQLVLFPMLLSGQGDIQQLLTRMIVAGLVVVIVSVVLLLITIGATLHIVVQEYIGRKAGLGEAFGVAFSRFGALLGTSILVGLLFLVAACACLIPGIVLSGTLLLIGVPVFLGLAIMFVIWYAFTSQVVIMERIGGPAALGRSKELGIGYGGRIFGVILLLGLIQWGIGLGAGMLQQVIPYQEAVPGPGGVPIPRFVSYPNFIINTVFVFLVSVIAQSYQAVCMTLLYLDLRIRKEGFDLEVAASQAVSQIGEALPYREPAPEPEKPDQW
jgi:hypothetical protein